MNIQEKYYTNRLMATYMSVELALDGTILTQLFWIGPFFYICRNDHKDIDLID